METENRWASAALEIDDPNAFIILRGYLGNHRYEISREDS